MPRSSQTTPLEPRRLVLALLASCTVWLVIQNTLLLLAMTWGDPGVVGRVTMTLVKAAALVTARFWTSPAGVAVAVAALLALVVIARPARSPEVRHG